MHDSQNTRAILKLLKLTADGELEWKEQDKEYVHLDGGVLIIGKVYVTEFKEKKFRIFRCKHETEGYVREYVWSFKDVLEVIDESSYSVWVFPEDDAVSDLYETINFKKIGGENIYDLILSED